MNAPYQPDLLAEIDDENQVSRDRSGHVCQPAHPGGGESSCFQQIREVVRGLAPYARRHRRWFAGGVCAAFGVVAAKLALPWPLRLVADGWNGTGAMTLPVAINPVLAMGAVFLALSFSLGFFDMLQRLYFARFSSATVKDLRADAMTHAVAMRLPDLGDLMTRFVGDSGRVSSGMRSFFVHVGTSLILLLGMTAILFHMETALGLIFTSAILLTLLVTACISRRIFINSMHTREKESQLASRLYAAIDDEADEDEEDEDADFGRGGRSAKASHTRLQGIATWSAHGIFGLAVLAALWVGSMAIEAGTMTSGDMVVLMMYALLLQSPSIHLARQGAKCGKTFCSAYRLVQISHLQGGS